MIVGTCVLLQNKSGFGLALTWLLVDLQEDGIPEGECGALLWSCPKEKFPLDTDVSREGNEPEEICSPCAVPALQALIIRGKFSVHREHLPSRGI